MAVAVRSRVVRLLTALNVAVLVLQSGCMDYLDSLAVGSTVVQPGPGMAPGLPTQWSGSPRTVFEVGTDAEVRRNGRYSAYIRALYKTVPADQFGVLTQSIRADAYRGARIRLSGWVRTADAGANGAGLWLRVDGAVRQPFDNMDGRRLTGTADWREASIVVDVPDNAIGIVFGLLLSSPGVAWVDDLRIDVVDASVAVTGLQLDTSSDTAFTAQTYDRTPMGPRNLDFEGVTYASATSESVAWVKNHSFAFTTDDPVGPLTDLEPLRQMVGNASLVALGEATHGTREFFRMKHRMLEWLVREKGFSYFGIEATFPEALDVDRYVQTGDGDPALLLSRLYFWTWNTQEVLDMIKWMRTWNAAGNQPKVHFVGFDMQFPGAALDSVENVVTRIDASAGVEVHDAYACLNQFRTTPSVTGSAGLERYVQQTPAFKSACRASLQQVDSLLARRETQWATVEGAERMRLVRHYARLVSQYEDMVTSTSGFVRDRAMAENVMWWHDTQAPGARMVLWAHNMHISRLRNWMGDHLTRKYGAGYLSIGQTFGSGSFNAVLGAPRPATDTTPGLRSHSVYGVRDESIEAVFQQVGLPRVIFDSRPLRASTEAGTAPLSLPMSIRAIGAVFDPRVGATGYQVSLLLKNDYDLLAWFQTGTASVLLPFPETAQMRHR